MRGIMVSERHYVFMILLLTGFSMFIFLHLISVTDECTQYKNKYFIDMIEDVQGV